MNGLYPKLAVTGIRKNGRLYLPYIITCVAMVMMYYIVSYLTHSKSVSSMAFRMKRNGASLASICILSTMVLVMISSTLCLFIGREDMIQKRYPRDIAISVDSDDMKYSDIIAEVSGSVLKERGLSAENVLQYRCLPAAGYLKGGRVSFELDYGTTVDYTKVLQLYFYTIDDYNRLMNKEETLTDDEIRKSINSQILTVFFAPLIMSGLHVGFAFPMILKLLKLFGLFNVPLLIAVTAGAFLIFALFYALVYKITSRSYYRIVSR